MSSLNPITLFYRKAIKTFEDIGFEIFEGPEIETEWFCFDGLNMPDDHPSRDVQDTFWLKEVSGARHPLRTHNTSIDLRVMKNRKPPIKGVNPGRCFRNEKLDATHETTFFQLDGFSIDKNITMADLKGSFEYFFKTLYGKNIEIRYRPHFYPFVEPGMDVDIKMKGKWTEILGSGMLHPIVLKNMGVDPKKWQGFAFGMGFDRLMMIKYGVNDIRLIHSGDLRFLSQFKV